VLGLGHRRDHSTEIHGIAAPEGGVVDRECAGRLTTRIVDLPPLSRAGRPPRNRIRIIGLSLADTPESSIAIWKGHYWMPPHCLGIQTFRLERPGVV
jgi:hypothetical protein